MKTKITQGEWQNIVVGSPNGFFHKVISDTESICNITTRDIERAPANAKLISAAPELLEALMSIENDNNSIPKAIWDLRNSAIKKATE